MTPRNRVALLPLLALLASCGPQTPPHDNHDGHDHGPGEQHTDQHDNHGHHGAVVALGSASAGPFNLVATRDDQPISPGGDAAFDITITPAAGSPRTVAAVRIWVGLQDAAGSIRARADIENPAEPTRWHTHAEVPTPLPDNASFWVEIEDDQGALHTASFTLTPAG